MANWEFKIDINPIIDSYSNDDQDFDNELAEVRRVSDLLMVELKKHSFIPAAVVDHFRVTRTEAGFNAAIDKLYNYCDKHKIWLGGL